MQDKIQIVIVNSGLECGILEEDDLMPLGDVVFFGGSRVHSLDEVILKDE